MLNFIKSWFNKDAEIICNINVIDDQEDKYDVMPLMRIYVQCNTCKKMKHVLIRCC